MKLKRIQATKLHPGNYLRLFGVWHKIRVVSGDHRINMVTGERTPSIRVLFDTGSPVEEIWLRADVEVPVSTPYDIV